MYFPNCSQVEIHPVIRTETLRRGAVWFALAGKKLVGLAFFATRWWWWCCVGQDDNLSGVGILVLNTMPGMDAYTSASVVVGPFYAPSCVSASVLCVGAWKSFISVSYWHGNSSTVSTSEHWENNVLFSQKSCMHHALGVSFL